MPFDYPTPMPAPFGSFEAVPLIDKPVHRAQPGGAKVALGGHRYPPVVLRKSPSPLVGVTQLKLLAHGRVSQSFHDGRGTEEEHRKQAIQPFWFCPGVDDAAVRLCWKTRHNEGAEKAVIEVFSLGLPGPVSVKEIGEAAGVPLDTGAAEAEAAGCRGSLTLDQVLDLGAGQHSDRFPDGKLTVEHSPYMIKLTLHKKQDANRALYPSAAWTFFHVLVDHLELEWGEEGMISGDGPQGAHASLQQEARTAERDLFRAVRARGIADPRHEVMLECPLFVGDQVDGQDPKVANTHEALTSFWGHGPRLPLRARVFLRKADGHAATFDESKAALGRPWFLWDWHDDAERWREWLTPGDYGTTVRTREFLESALRTDEAPSRSANAPKRYGGKRGDPTKPVFPAMAEGSSLGYEVRPSQERPWASLSRAGEAAKAGTTAVLFQPGPFIGDQYTVTVALTSVSPFMTDDDRPSLEVKDPAPLMQVLENAPSPPPQASTGTFDVRRRVPVKLVTVGPPLENDLVARVREQYQRLGIELDLSMEVLPTDWMSRRWRALYDELAAGDDWNIKYAFGLLEDQPADYGDRLFHIRPYEEFKQTIIDRLQTGNVYSFVAGDAATPGERIKTTPGNAYAIGSRPCPGQNGLHEWIVLMHGDAILAPEHKWGLTLANELKELRQLLASPVRVRQAAAQPNQPRDEIRLEFTTLNLPAADRTVTVRYKRGMGRSLKRSVPREAKEALRALFRRITADPRIVQRGVPLDVRMHLPAGREDERHAERVSLLRDAVHATYQTTYNFMDATPMAAPLFATITERQYTDSFKNLRFTIMGLMKELGEEKPDWTGPLFLVGRKLGNWQITGSVIDDISRQRRPLGVIWMGLDLVSKAALFTPAQLVMHELGHAIFVNHARAGTWMGDLRAASTFHVPYDACIMTYDAEPTTSGFCGGCLLALRGWKDVPVPNDLAPAIDQLERDRKATKDERAHVWKTLRLAHLTFLAKDRARTRDLLFEALVGWNAEVVEHDSKEGVALLRMIIEGLRYKVDEQKEARFYYEKLERLTQVRADLDFRPGEPIGFRTPIVRVEVMEDGAPVNAEVTQFVNLSTDEAPRKQAFAQQLGTSVDRVGHEVKVKVTFAAPGRHAFQLQLVGHVDNLDYTTEERTNTESFNYEVGEHRYWLQDRALTKGYQPLTDGVTDDDGTKIASIELPPTGGNKYIIMALDADKEAVESTTITTERAVFYQRVLCAQPVRDNVAPAGPTHDRLVAAFKPLHVRPIAVADALLDTQRHFDAREGKYNQFFADAAPLGDPHAVLRPHLVQFVMVDNCVGSAALKRVQIEVDLNAAAPELAVPDGKALWTAEGLQGDLFADLIPDPGVRPEYIGDGSAKPWLAFGEFKLPDQTKLCDLTIDDLEPLEKDPAQFTGRFDRVRATLQSVRQRIANLPEPRPTTGTLVCQLLCVGYVGGVAFKSPWQLPITTRLPFGNAGDDHERQAKKMTHELGHSMGMAPSLRVSGLKEHDTYFERNGHHCSFGMEGLANDPATYDANRDKSRCVMFDYVAGTPTFCEHCEPLGRKLDLGDCFSATSRVYLACR